jgi:hypothetical protein
MRSEFTSSACTKKSIPRRRPTRLRHLRLDRRVRTGIDSRQGTLGAGSSEGARHPYRSPQLGRGCREDCPIACCMRPARRGARSSEQSASVREQRGAPLQCGTKPYPFRRLQVLQNERCVRCDARGQIHLVLPLIARRVNRQGIKDSVIHCIDPYQLKK